MFLNFASVRHFAAALVALLLVSCSAPVSVHPTKPIPPAGAVEKVADTEHRLASIREAFQQYASGDSSALIRYNYEVARLIEDLGKHKVDPWSVPLVLSGSSGIKTLKTTFPADIDPTESKLFPADFLKFRGKYAHEQSIVQGVGAPMVAVKSFAGLGHRVFRKDLPLRNLTAVVRFDGDVATLNLIDPYQTEVTQFAGSNRTLSADYSAAVMLGMSKARIDKLGIRRLIWPARYDDTTHLNFLQPYDPKRIPVLMVHGLDSTPATFAPLYFKLLEDPKIREHYQFWIFSYPSGYAYPYSASLLRRELDAVQSEFPENKEIIIIGHSMGTLLARLMVTDAGEELWVDTFGKSVSETKISGRSRDRLESTLVFEKRPEINRAIFISGPHRGSELAADWVGRLFTRLIRLPGTIADIRNAVVSAATVDPSALMIADSPNSIATLDPTNPFVEAINKIPVAPNVTFHSIMGDRGKGDTPDSSDGVVPYWSSHLDGAASEKIVPSGHPAHQHPVGIEEVQRILIDHLK